MEQTSVFLKLPYELIAGVLPQLDHVQQLSQARLACCHINNSFLQDRTIPMDVLKNQIGFELIPFAVASYRLSHSSSTTEECESLLHDLHLNEDRLASEAQRMSASEIARLSTRHDVVRKFATQFASSAWANLEIEAPLTLSVAEDLRLCRSFYRFDLLCGFLRAYRPSLESERMVLLSMKRYALSWHSPWVNEQVACAHDFLESRLLEAIRETVAHDVEFGEHCIDYLSWGQDNYTLQGWLLCGLEFIHTLIITTDKDRQVELLRGSPMHGNLWGIYQVLDSELDDRVYDEEDSKSLEDYSSTELEALVPYPDSAEANTGPYEAWYLANLEEERSSFVMSENANEMRARAYVLWDLERLQRYGLLQSFKAVERYSDEIDTDDAEEYMERTWHKRSLIWKEGGRGFWYENDRSQIIWPGRPAGKSPA